MRFRVEAPVATLRARGHAVEVFDPARAASYDTVVFCKSYGAADQALARDLVARGARAVLDLCDNHFYNPYDLPRYRRAAEDLRRMAALAGTTTVATEALAAVVRSEVPGAEPVVVGDFAEHIALPEVPRPERTMLLWFGSHGSPNAPAGMNDLLRIVPELRAAYAETPFELVVASNDAEKFAALAPRLGVPARYETWDAARFPALLAQAAAVLIPLSPNPFVACKTHNRMTTALGCGVPVVSDAIDSYREFAPFCTLDDWSGGLRLALREPEAARVRAAGAARHIARHWSPDAIAARWEAALGLPPSSRPEPAAVLSEADPVRADAAPRIDAGATPAGTLADRLAEELRQLDAAMDQVRSIAARIVIVAGERS